VVSVQQKRAKQILLTPIERPQSEQTSETGSAT
jgi:hypothetical protein